MLILLFVNIQEGQKEDHFGLIPKMHRIGYAPNDSPLTQVGIPVFVLQILPHVIPYVTDYAELPRVLTFVALHHSEKEV